MSRDEATLLDIERSAQLIIEFTHGIDLEDFLDDVRITFIYPSTSSGQFGFSLHPNGCFFGSPRPRG
jgi:hypothetical protein